MDIHNPICFGINWQTATPEDVAGVGIKEKDLQGNNPLHWAVRYNENPAVVEALLGSGAKVSARNEGGLTPLHMAGAFNENSAVMESLLKADVWSERIPLGTRDVMPSKPVVQFLPRDTRRTPLHMAAVYNKNPSVVKALLKAGAEADVWDEDGLTPLHLAARHNENPAVMEALLNAGAEVNARSVDGYTPLHEAARLNETLAVVEALLKAGAEINARGKDGETPLHLAARFRKNFLVVAVLLNAGADAKTKTDNGKTPFDYIKENESLKDSAVYWVLHDAQFE